MATEKSSFPAVAAGASAEEQERLIQEALDEAAYYESQRVSVIAHDAVRANIEAGTASLLRRLAALLRATPAAPVPSEAQIAPSRDDVEMLARAWDATRPGDYGPHMVICRWTDLWREEQFRVIAFVRALSASLPPVEGAEQDLQLREMSPAQRRAFAAELERDVPTAGDYARAMRRASLPPAGDVFVGTVPHPASCPHERCRLDGECNDDKACPTKAAPVPPVEGAGVEEAQGPIEDCPECDGVCWADIDDGDIDI